MTLLTSDLCNNAQVKIIYSIYRLIFYIIPIFQTVRPLYMVMFNQAKYLISCRQELYNNTHSTLTVKDQFTHQP